MKKLKLISILFLSICTFLLLNGIVYAEGGVGVTGSFSTFEYKIVQGETIATPLVNVIFVNNYDHEIKLRIYQDTPDGVNVQIDNEFVTVAANSRIDLPIVISAAEDAIPGEYEIYVKAKLIEELVEGKVNVGSEFALKTKMTVFGEAADFDINIVDVAGNEIRAVMNLYHIENTVRTPLAFSDSGTMVERVIPGDYEVIAFWNDYQLVRHQFSLVTGQQYQKTLVAQTVQIYAYSVSPVFIENTDDELATASIRFILHNIYKELDNSRVVLVVYKDGEMVEERDIFLFDTLEVNRHELGIHYVPAQGWGKSEYKFVLEFYVDMHDDNGEIVSSTLYATSLPAILDVSGFSFKKLTEFLSGRLTLVVFIAGLLVGLYFLIRYLLKRTPAAVPSSPAIPAPKAVARGVCTDCNGQGDIMCPICDGKGTTLYEGIVEECMYCSGIGQVMCGTCINPKQLAVCPRCNGEKQIMLNNKPVECTYCNGLGHVVALPYVKYKDGQKLKLGKRNK